MTNSTRARMTGGLPDDLVGQFYVELERLNYGRETINLYKRSIRRLSQLMVSRGLALDQLTPEIAAQLVLRAELARCSTRVRCVRRPPLRRLPCRARRG